MGKGLRVQSTKMRLKYFLCHLLTKLAHGYKCSTIDIPCILYDSIFPVLRENFQDGSSTAVYLDKINKSDFLDYTMKIAVPVFNDLSGDMTNINMTDAMIKIFSQNFTDTFHVEIEINALRDMWAIPAAEWAVDFYTEFEKVGHNVTTLEGRLNAAVEVVGALEKFLSDRAKVDALSDLVDRPLELVGYLENAIDIAIFANDLAENGNNGTTADTIAELLEPSLDLFASIFISNNLVVDYIKSDITPVIDELRNDRFSNFTSVQVLETLEKLMTRNLGELMGLYIDFEQFGSIFIFDQIKQFQNFTNLINDINSGMELTTLIELFIFTLGNLTESTRAMHSFVNASIYQVTELFKTGDKTYAEVKFQLELLESAVGNLHTVYRIATIANTISLMAAAEFTNVAQMQNNIRKRKIEMLELALLKLLSNYHQSSNIKTDYVEWPLYKFMQADYFPSIKNEKDPLERLNMILSENLGALLGWDNMELLRTSFASPLANMTAYLVGSLTSDNNFGFLDDSDAEMVLILNNIRFLKNVMVNAELVLNGLYSVTNKTLVGDLSTVVKYANDILLFRIGWLADQLDVFVPTQFRFESIVSEIIEDHLGGNFTNTTVKLEAVILLIQQQWNDVQELLSVNSLDNLEDVFDTLKDLISALEYFFDQLYEDMTDAQREKFGFVHVFAGYLDTSDGSNIAVITANVLGVVANVAGGIDNIQNILDVLLKV